MDISSLLGLPDGLAVESLDRTSATLTVSLFSPSVTACCPRCGTSAERVHSCYQRTVADLPCGAYQVLLRLRVRRFFCPNSSCALRLFAERLPDLVQPYARKTLRLLQALHAIGLTAGGEGGARLTQHLHLPTSPPTLLRGVKTLLTPPAPPVRVLGVDDWGATRSRMCSCKDCTVFVAQHWPRYSTACPLRPLPQPASTSFTAR